MTKFEATIPVRAGEVQLAADIALPEGAVGVVLFAHGSGSSRLSPRNRHVAEVLRRGRMGTILMDLLTEDEEVEDAETGRLRFDIELLARRLALATDWVGVEERLWHYPIGYFGASTGAAAALRAAAERPGEVRAVVSRGGRPDLAGGALSRVAAPCLFIVGGNDSAVLRLNREAMAMLPAEVERSLEVVPGATHLFEEPGTLDRVAQLARDWFLRHFSSVSR